MVISVRSVRGAIAVVVLAAMALSGCGGDGPRPLASGGASVDPAPSVSPSTSPATSAPAGDEYLISDARVTKVEGTEGFIHWVVTFDASWDGSSPPEEALCTWRTYDSSGTENFRAARTIDGPGDDIEIGDVYPDEIAGVPVEAKVTCRQD
jgi:hypothetical protein